MKELKIYEKHNGYIFLLGKIQDETLEEKIKHTKTKLLLSDDELKDLKIIIKRELNEDIVWMTVLKRADKRRHGNLQTSFKNSYLLGTNDYPSTIPDLLKVLNNYQPQWESQTTEQSENSSGNRRTAAVSFLQSSGKQIMFWRATNNSFFQYITCQFCAIKGHYQSHCPVAINAEGVGITTRTNSDSEVNPDEVSLKLKSFLKNGVNLNQNNDSYINPNWVLLNSETTDHIFCNKYLLTDIQPVTDEEALRMHSSGGHIDTQHKGRFGGFLVWYNPKHLANILSLSLVMKKYQVTLDSYNEYAIVIHISAKHIIKFISGPNGLYYFDSSNTDLIELRHAFSFLNTVSNNMKFFEKRGVRKASDAILLNRKINHPS